jgi:translation initiation factor IF-3
MNAWLKQAGEKVRKPVRSTGRKPAADEMHERVMSRYPKTMASLAE